MGRSLGSSRLSHYTYKRDCASLITDHRSLTDVVVIGHVGGLRALAAVAEHGGGDEAEEGQGGAEDGAGHGVGGPHLLLLVVVCGVGGVSR